MWDPIAYALGFIDCDQISARCMLTIFMLFAIRTEVRTHAHTLFFEKADFTISLCAP